VAGLSDLEGLSDPTGLSDQAGPVELLLAAAMTIAV
jgi:hypothetical protein